MIDAFAISADSPFTKASKAIGGISNYGSRGKTKNSIMAIGIHGAAKYPTEPQSCIKTKATSKIRSNIKLTFFGESIYYDIKLND